ncbi:MAG TPA: hypothetical protein VMV46_05220 [Thermoanaerobaculia bacterium]|nr:hypothetical protein [Thermoanaerobaculia bacterium]
MRKHRLMWGAVLVSGWVSVVVACAPQERAVQEAVDAAVEEVVETIANAARGGPRTLVSVAVCDATQGCDCAATDGCVPCDTTDVAGLVFRDPGGAPAVEQHVQCTDKRGRYCFSEQARVVWLIGGLGAGSHRGVIAHEDKGAGSPADVYEVPPADGGGAVLLQSLGFPEYTGTTAEWEYRLDLYENPTATSDGDLLACADPKIVIDP